MKKSRIIRWVAVSIAASAFAFSPRAANAATTVIEFPEEELASESVLPLLDHPESVKQRTVVTAGRVELGLTGGYNMTEPFFQPWSFGALLGYHFNEDHGLNILGTYTAVRASDYNNQLNPVPGTSINANLQYAPSQKYLLLGSYQFTGYYGKISLTKETVMNLSLYGLLGGGVMGFGDTTLPVANIGIGQKFYMGSSFALRFDLRLLMYQGPDIISKPLDSKTTVQSPSYFDQKLQMETLLTFGAVYLFPSF